MFKQGLNFLGEQSAQVFELHLWARVCKLGLPLVGFWISPLQTLIVASLPLLAGGEAGSAKVRHPLSEQSR